MSDTDRLAALQEVRGILNDHIIRLARYWRTSHIETFANEAIAILDEQIAAGVGFVGDADHYPGCDRNPCRCAGYTATPAPCPVHGVECGIVPTDFGQQIANPEARPKGLPIAATPAPLPPANPSLMGTIQ